MTASSFTPTTGDDVDDLLNANGGVGEWEVSEGSEAGSVERWSFPRFHPPCPKCGDRITPDAEGIYRCAAHPKTSIVMDEADMYMSRTGIGNHDTDVETVVAWLDAPRNIVGAVLVIGEPGTGKTALIEAAATHSNREVTTVVFTPDHSKDSLFLRFVGEGKGDCVNHDHPTGEDGTCVGGCTRGAFTLGPLTYAAKHGHLFYGDEVYLLPDGVKPVLYSLADGRRYLPEGNLDASPLEIHPNFRMALSSNPMVRGASMPEPLASRCASTTITVETNAAMLRDLGIDESVVAAWEALGAANLWQPQIREVRLADYWLGVDATQAASAFLPEHCPESQREAVKNIVVGFIGGDLPKNGRLVVS